MNRRSFMEKAGVLGAAAILPLSSCNQVSESESDTDLQKEEKMTAKYKLGYQLFSVNKDMNNDPIGTLKKLKAMGYQDFEIYGFDPEKVTYYGIDALDFKAQLDELGLSVTSGHYGFSDYFLKSEAEMEQFVDQIIKGSTALNAPYITWPWVAPDRRNLESYKVLAQKLNRIGEQAKAAGLGFAYHNHGYEFTDHGGQNCYDIVIKETDPDLVKLQMDMYWVMHEEITTPKELVKRQPGRFVMWHIKDMHKESRDYTELGNGSINYLEVLPDPKDSGLEYVYIEQGGNFTESAIKSAETSAIYYKENLLKLL